VFVETKFLNIEK